MSFGYGASDAVLLTQLAWRVVEGSRKAYGEHAELTREALGLHSVLRRVQDELSSSESLLSLTDETRRIELGNQIAGCEKVLEIINSVLVKYNGLEDDKRSGKKLWQKIRFGNGEMHDLSDIRLKLSTHTSAITLTLNLILLGSQGKVEAQLTRQGGDLQGIKESLNLIAIKIATTPEHSVMTSYSHDSKRFWRALRRELVRDGYPSDVIRPHKRLILAYIKELGDRGALDEKISTSTTSMSPNSTAELLLEVSSTLRVSEQEVPRAVISLTEDNQELIPNVKPESEVLVSHETLPSITSIGPIMQALMPTSRMNSSADEGNLDQYDSQDQVTPDGGSPIHDPVQDSELSLSENHIPQELSHDFLGDSDVSTNISKLGSSVSLENPQLLHHQALQHNLNMEMQESKGSFGTEVSSAIRTQETGSESQEECELLSIPVLSTVTLEALPSEQLLKTQSSQDLEPSIDREVHTAQATSSGDNAFGNLDSSEDNAAILAAEIKAAITPISSYDLPARSTYHADLSNFSHRRDDDESTTSAMKSVHVIHFKDTVGRKYVWPYEQCRTWEAVHELIKSCFTHIDFIGPFVIAGNYNLLGPHDEIILPQLWESMVQPDWHVMMQMWPSPEISKAVLDMEMPSRVPSLIRSHRRPSSFPDYLKPSRKSKKGKGKKAEQDPCRVM